MTNLPSWDCYCSYTTSTNALVFTLSSDLRIWFSYKTPVAFKFGRDPIKVRQNDWGPTTGKHLNAIDNGDKKSRLDGETFEALLELALGEEAPEL